MDYHQDTKEFIGVKAEYDREGQLVWGINKAGEQQRLLDVRSWGAIQNLPAFKKDGKIDLTAAAAFQDKLGEFITEAINEKLKGTNIDNAIKAAKWDELGETLSGFYSEDEDGNQEEEGDLVDIGEAAAIAYGYL